MIGLTTGRHPQNETAYSLESAAHFKWSAAPSKPKNCYSPNSMTSHKRHYSNSKGLHQIAACRRFLAHRRPTRTTWQQFFRSSFNSIIIYTNYPLFQRIQKPPSPPSNGIHQILFFYSCSFRKYIHTLIIIQNLRIQQDSMAGLTKETYDYMFKVIVIGDSGVGKTNLILRFSDKNFNNNYVATIGVDFKIKTITIGDKRVRLQLWDTAGQERFRTITQTYYKGAAGIILTYSIDDRKTFENITKWMKQIKEKTPPHVQKLIVANKCDLESERKVQYEQGQNLAKQLSDDTCKVQFIEVSAKSGKNVMQAFSKISLQIKQYVEANQTMAPKSSVIRIQKESSKPNSCKC